MDRLDHFDTIFVRIMLGLILVDLLHSVFSPEARANGVALFSDNPLWWWRILLFFLFVLFIIKYIQTLSVLLYHQKENEKANILVAPEIRNRFSIPVNVGFLLSRVLLLVSLYFIASILFDLNKAGSDNHPMGEIAKGVFVALVIGGYILPNVLYLRVNRIWIKNISDLLVPTTLDDVYLSWAGINGLNIILIIAAIFSKYHSALSLDVVAVAFLAFNTLFDWFNNHLFFFGHCPLKQSAASTHDSQFEFLTMEGSKMKWKRITVASVLIIIVVGIGLLAYWKSKHNAPATTVPATKASVRLKWTYSAGFAGLIAGVENGDFKNRGLELTLEPGSAQLDPIRQVASGQDQFGMCGADRLLQARDQGIPVVAIALENRDSFVGFTALKDSGIDNPKAFEGHTVGTMNDDTFTIYQALINKQGVDRSKVKEKPVGYDMQALLSHDVDVYPSYVINQPVVLKERGIDVEVIRPKIFGVDFAGVVYFTTERYLRDHRSEVEAFVFSLIDGWKYAMDHSGDIVDKACHHDSSLKINEETRLLVALIDELKAQQKSTGRNMLWIEPGDFAETQRIMLDQKLLPRPVDLNSAVNDEFVKKYYSLNH
jgi:NitT/TauT family transport system substrate-binding protein